MSEVSKTVIRPELRALTGIRFGAAFLVFLFHMGAGFAASIGLPHPIVQFLENGFLGVSLFFVLSGFILTYTYQDKLDLNFGKLSKYAIARFARLYPVYLLILLAFLPFAMDGLTTYEAVRVLTMTQSWTAPGSSLGWAWVMQAWTLSVEFVFYLAFPFLLVLMRGFGKRAIWSTTAMTAIAIVALAVPFCNVGGSNSIWMGSAIPIPIVRLIEFVYGMLLGFIYLRSSSNIGKALREVFVISILVMIGGLLSFTNNPYLLSFAVALVGPLLLLLSEGQSITAKFLGTKFMVLLGGASYVFYLAQGPVRHTLGYFLEEDIARAINPIVLLLVSIAIFRYWEQPARIIIKRWASSFTQKARSILSTRMAKLN